MINMIKKMINETIVLFSARWQNKEHIYDDAEEIALLFRSAIPIDEMIH